MVVQSPRVRAYLELVRLPNLFTAVGDIVAGYLIAAQGRPTTWPDLLLLAVASVALYAAGVVLNDYFDLDVDRIERPERPIPSGRIHAGRAARLGFGFLGVGCALAAIVGTSSMVVAAILAACIVLYDARGKRIEYVGSANMGACRFLNVLLGASATIDGSLGEWLWLVVPVATLVFIYIAAVTILATGEVWGGNRVISSLVFAAIVVVIGGVLWLGLSGRLTDPLLSLPFLALFAAATLRVSGRVIGAPTAPNIRQAIKVCVLSLLMLDAAIAAGAGGLGYGLGVAALIVPALYAARLYAVT